MFGVSGRSMRLVSMWGGLAFVVNTVQYATAQIVAASAWNPSYRWKSNYISDLGNTACGQFAVHGPTTFACSPFAHRDELNLGPGNGGMERLAGYPGNLWMLVVGVTIVVTGTRTLRRQRVASRTVAEPAF
jgi:hypothetical membrane protein